MPSENTSLVFPRSTGIPANYRLASPLDQNVYLVNGELRQWKGATQEVLSPVCLSDKGEPAQHLIGR